MNSVSTTMSAPFRTSTAERWPESGVLPTVQTPTSPPLADDEYGSRRFIGLAPSRCAAVMNASTYSARSSPCESTTKRLVLAQLAEPQHPLAEVGEHRLAERLRTHPDLRFVASL